jgi:Zn-dependent membrane protease YugP
MKYLINVIAIVIFTSVILFRILDNSIESDAKKLAEVMCKSQQLSKIKNKEVGEAAHAVSQELMQEAASLKQEIIKKYKDPIDYKQFTSNYIEEIGKCK